MQEVVDAGHDGKKTDYIGNFVYQNDSLQFASTAVGRTVWNEDSVKEEYFVKDHLGNVRSIIDVYHYPILQYLASYEIASAQLEELVFDDVAGIRDEKPGSTDPDDQMAGRLNGAEPDHQVGTSILVKVMAGDKVQINADNYYDGTYNPDNDRPVDAETMLNSIVSTLTGGEGGLGESESHAPQLVPKLFNPENFLEADNMMHSEADPNRPKAFLNYVLFDQNMRVVRTFTGAWQANGDGGWETIGNDEAMTIPVNGFLAVYLSNATSIAQCQGCINSEGDVYFDKLKIRFTRGNLKQETHYYPFGLPMAGIGSSAMGMTPNRQKYQSNEYITDAGLNWMSFGARQYDPQLGRFLSVDPMASEGGQDMLSSYQAMGNNPVRFVDPNGLLIHIGEEIHDEKVFAYLNNLLGQGNYSLDENNNLVILPGHQDDIFAKLVKDYNASMDGNGSAAANKAAAEYAQSVIDAINGDSKNASINKGENGHYQVGGYGILADVGITGEKMSNDLNTTIKNSSLILNGATYIPLTTIGLAYTKPIRTVLNPNIVSPTIGELRVMVDAGKKFEAFGKTVGGVGLALTYLDAGSQYITTGTVKNSTAIDATISTVLYIGSFSSGPAAPIFWTAGAIYGGVRLLWGDQIDNWIDNYI